VPIVIDRPYVSSRTQLDSGSVARDMVVPADKATEPFRKRMDYASVSDARGNHNQHAITAILMKALAPRDVGVIEGLFQNLIQLLM
jgi:hypothetical protein